MANKITGNITVLPGGPLPPPRFRVRAWDDDWPDGDDLLGETLTDGNGQYKIFCMGRIYDDVLPGLKTGYPDIYITTDIKNKRDQWVRVGRSEVFYNFDLAGDLHLDLDITIDPPVSITPTFTPMVDGFLFNNDFKFRPDFLNIEFKEQGLGFCGGMCAAALHRFVNGEDVEKTEKVPLQGSALYEELMRRQIRSMPPNILAKMYHFQTAPDSVGQLKKASIGQLTKKEWPQLKGELDKGIPTILILLRSKGLYANPTNNHQVLAIGYNYDPARKDLEILVYDPNVKKRVISLIMNLALPDGKLHFKDTTGKRTRGFFVNDAGKAASKLPILE